MNYELRSLVEALNEKGIHVIIDRAFDEIEFDFSEHDKKFKERIGFLTRKNEKLFDENASLKQRIAELESKESETCGKEPISDDARPSIEWYENRHQSDYIEINRLHTALEVMTEKYMKLREVHGL